MDRKMDNLLTDMKTTKAQLHNLSSLVADLLKGREDSKQLQGEVDGVKAMAARLEDDLLKQHDLIMSLSSTLNGGRAEVLVRRRERMCVFACRVHVSVCALGW